jgi:hypothetical protein
MTAVSGTLSPNPFLQLFNDAGQPLNGAWLYTYVAESSTPAPTFADVGLTTPNPNPIVLTAAGRVPSGAIFLTPGQSYKYVLYVAGVLVATYDDIAAVPSSLKNAQYGVQPWTDFTTSVVYPAWTDFTPFTGSVTTRGGQILAQVMFPAQMSAGNIAYFQWNLDGTDQGSPCGAIATTYVDMTSLQWLFTNLSVGTHQVKLRVTTNGGTFSSLMSNMAGSYSLLEVNV